MPSHPLEAVYDGSSGRHPYETCHSGSKLTPAPTARLAFVLDRLGVDLETYIGLRSRSVANGSTLAEEIVQGGHATERQIADLIAEALSLLTEDPDADVTILKDSRGASRQGRHHLVATTSGCATRAYIAPDLMTLDQVAEAMPTEAWERESIRIATPASIASIRLTETLQERSDAARLSLAADLNRWSARDVMTGFQGGVLTALVLGLGAAIVVWHQHIGVAFHLLFTFVAFACTAFRAVVFWQSPRAGCQAVEMVAEPDVGPPPVYSVLIALHHEAEMAESLVAAMAALDWPASRLEVLFVCEATDPETVTAVERAIVRHPNFSVVVVPASEPKTKPKALNFALPLTRGEFVVLYDAEDIPHPGQLREAWARFRRSDDSLACLQAPLVVTNGASGWRQAHYTMEYAVLFRMLLPWLARRSLPLPLGGTSNHFRRKHLVSAGGWDSHNVAEDADLGLRLSRLGFQTGTISSPTLETSTVRWRDWRNQRTRWIKGWIQTWLVHMRDPRLTTRQLTGRGMAAFQIVFLGMVASSFANLALVTQLMVLIAAGVLLESGFENAWLYGLDALNLVAAYIVFGLSFMRVARPDERPLAGKLWLLGAYWAVVSYAGLRAISQLWRTPHLWEKTPHSSSHGFEGPRLLAGPS